MDENLDSETFERLISIGRIRDVKNNIWLPSIKDEKSHDIDPSWVAAVMFLVFDRYIQNILDEHQNEFYEKVLFYFDLMKKDGLNYLVKVDLEE